MSDEVYLKALKYKTWIVGNELGVEKVDRAMEDFILSGATGFSPKPGMTHLDVLRHFYDNLYPFCERLVAQFLYAHQEIEAHDYEIKTLLKRNAKRLESVKLMEKFLKDRGIMNEYDQFKKEFFIAKSS